MRRTLTAARWIVGRQALPGAYGGTFAGFPSERSKGIALFTGERVGSPSARHILGEEASRRNPGLYCCGKCSVGLWRNLLAGGLDRHQERLRRGALHLRSMRDAEHQWRKFPFWYTVLALSEMDNAEARTELKYAAPALERASSRAVPSEVYARRRYELAVRTLNRF